jgi:hypothetical protein
MAKGAAQLQSDVIVSMQPIKVISIFSGRFIFTSSQIFRKIKPHIKGQAILVAIKNIFDPAFLRSYDSLTIFPVM